MGRRHCCARTTVWGSTTCAPHRQGPRSGLPTRTRHHHRMDRRRPRLALRGRGARQTRRVMVLRRRMNETLRPLARRCLVREQARHGMLLSEADAASLRADPIRTPSPDHEPALRDTHLRRPVSGTWRREKSVLPVFLWVTRNGCQGKGRRTAIAEPKGAYSRIGEACKPRKANESCAFSLAAGLVTHTKTEGTKKSL